MVDMASEGVDRRESIPIVPKASHDTGYTVPISTTHDKGGYDMQFSEMLQWPLALWLPWLCVTFFKGHLKLCSYIYLKLASGENKLLILTFGNSKYSELK